MAQVVWMNKAQNSEDDHWLRHSLLPSEPNLYSMNASTGAPLVTASLQCTPPNASVHTFQYKGHHTKWVAMQYE